MVSVGTDIEQIPRMEQILRRNPRFVRRIFTPSEIAYCDSKRNPAQHYTARFCAKEAFIKAMGASFSRQEIEVYHQTDGRPAIHVTGKAESALNGRNISLSISHSGGYAIATVVIDDSY